jgi:hypothetical protein
MPQNKETKTSLVDELLPSNMRQTAAPSVLSYDVRNQMQLYKEGLLPGDVRASDGGDDSMKIKSQDEASR